MCEHLKQSINTLTDVTEAYMRISTIGKWLEYKGNRVYIESDKIIKAIGALTTAAVCFPKINSFNQKPQMHEK